MKIVVLEGLGVSREEIAALEAPFVARGHSFAHMERTEDAERLKASVCDADAVILANMPLPAAAIEAGERLALIDVAFTGVDHVAVDAARARGITVCNASGYSTEAVSELAIAMALNLSRSVHAADARCRAGQTGAGLRFCELKGKTAGIIGLGKIGTRTAELFHAFGAQVLAASRSVHANAPDYVTQTDRETLLSRADYVILHCPLTAETRGMIDARALSLMKPTAYLLNLARGAVVNSGDLRAALDAGTLAGAGIDVFSCEPPLCESEPLLHAKNCLLTPHIGYSTQEAMLARAQIVFDNLAAWLAGTPQNVV